MSIKKVSIAIPFWKGESFKNLVNHLVSVDQIDNVLVYGALENWTCERGSVAIYQGIDTSEGLSSIVKSANHSNLLVLLQPVEIRFQHEMLSDFIRCIEESNTGLVYSNYYVEKNEKKHKLSLSTYQMGSVRDDFDFGPLIAINLDRVSRKILEDIAERSYSAAALYSFRLKIAGEAIPKHISNYLYSQLDDDGQNYEQRLFAYVDKENRNKQIELEAAFTEFAKEAGFYLEERKEEIDFDIEKFSLDISVVIPVKNREKTIADAIGSALSQKGDFKFNVIVVDNYSTDKTTSIIEKISERDQRVVHLVPERKDLGIGGCWDFAVNSKHVGKFVVQLDSDDLYSHEHALEVIFNKFYQEKCAAVVGSYNLVDFDLKEIPPGLIDHKEWTDTNGHNNGFRINGFGAPRAFYTPVIRKIGFPNVSYGEDYAVMLAVTRDYKLGRIYESLYLCRRWGENSESNITQEAINRNNHFKDSVRTKEILERIRLNKS